MVRVKRKEGSVSQAADEGAQRIEKSKLGKNKTRAVLLFYLL